MSRTPNASVRRLVQATKCAIVGALSFMTVVTSSTIHTQGVTAGQEIATVAPHQARVDTLIVRHQCSRTGFGPGVTPGSAIVLRGGKVQHVSFDTGWSVYTGATSGTLLAVCRVTL